MLRSFVGSTSVDAAEFGYSFGYTMAPPEKILLARIHSGAIKLQTEHGPPEVFGRGRVGAIGTLGGEPFTGMCHRGSWDTFLIDSVFLEQVAAPSCDGRIKLTGSGPISEVANKHLVAAMDYLRDTVAADPEVAQNPLIAGEAQRYLAACILAAYPNTAKSEGAVADRLDSTT